MFLLACPANQCRVELETLSAHEARMVSLRELPGGGPTDYSAQDLQAADLQAVVLLFMQFNTKPYKI